MTCLTKSQQSILNRKEETAQQKSRINWIASGDSNTKFYHQYANARRIHNHIWDILVEDGTVLYKQGDLEEEAYTYFNSVFKKQENLSIVAQMELIMKYPRMFGEQEGERLFAPVSLREILSTLKEFDLSKSPGPDGWTVEFFLHFYDMVGPDLLAMVE